jgi:hypothetical protein
VGGVCRVTVRGGAWAELHETSAARAVHGDAALARYTTRSGAVVEGKVLYVRGEDGVTWHGVAPFIR